MSITYQCSKFLSNFFKNSQRFSMAAFSASSPADSSVDRAELAVFVKDALYNAKVMQVVMSFSKVYKHESLY